MRGPVSDLPVTLSDVTVVAGRRPILDGVSTTVAAGPPTAIVGPNGSGKTTLLRILAGLLPPTSGAVSWAGRPDVAPERRALVFQRPVMLRRSVAGNVAFALSGVASAERHHRVDQVLNRTGLVALRQRPARRLSGGEQQRVALARALVREPDLLLLDEPGNNLDPAAAKAVEAIIADAAASGIKVVMATHDLGQARRLAGDVLFLVGGRLLEHAPAEAFFAAPATPEGAAFLRGDLVE
jgi:tungstate transport system ATP-binding protein